MQKENPDKVFYPLTPLPACEDMKLITLEDIASCLENNSNEVILDDEIMTKARLPIDRMIALS